MGFDEKRRYLVPIVVLSQLMGLTAVACGIYYAVAFPGDRSGLDLRIRERLELEIYVYDRTLTVTLLLLIIILYLNGTAMVLYRAFPAGKKPMLKVIHAIIQFASMCTVIGGVIYISYSGFGPFWRDRIFFSTLFSWMAVTSCGLFILQWVVAFIIFVLPTSQSLRASYLPIHRTSSGVILLLGTITHAIVTLECAFINEEKYTDGFNLVNFTGVFIQLFGTLVSAILLTDSYKHPAHPTSEQEGLDNDAFKLSPVHNN